jgi:hypothetical protein
MDAEKFRDPQLIRAVDAMKGALVYSNIQSGTDSAEVKEEPKKSEEKKSGDQESEKKEEK